MGSTLQSSVTANGVLITNELKAVQAGVDQIASKVTTGYARFEANRRTAQNVIDQRVLQISQNNTRGFGKLEGDFRRTKLLIRRTQLQNMRQLRKLNYGKRQLDEALSQLLSLQLRTHDSDAEADFTEYPEVEAIAYALVQMRPHLNDLIAELRSDSRREISDDMFAFLIDEFQRLVTYCNQSAASRVCDGDTDPEDQRLKLMRSATMRPDYSMGLDDVPSQQAMRRRHEKRARHESNKGFLELHFEERVGDCNGRPTTTQRASFRFLPNSFTQDIGVYASFCESIQMTRKPYISRSLREIRLFQTKDEVHQKLEVALEQCDVSAIQRMLSLGQIRPWDHFETWEYEHNLLEVIYLSSSPVERC